MKKIILFTLFLLFCSTSFAQDGRPEYFQGFTEEISGKTFGYHSPIPDVNTALILRGQSEYDPIAWKTETVPKDYQGDFVTYIWLFSIGVNANQADFHLAVNNKKWFSFNNPSKSKIGQIKYQGENGSELIFNVTMLDTNKDHMGFALVKLPVSAIELGTSNVIEISTSSVGNPTWLMTYKTQIEESINIYQNNVVSKKDGELFHSVSVDFLHIGDEAMATVLINGIETETALKAGYNKVEIILPKAEKETEFKAEIQIEGKELVYRNFTLKPVKEWEIYLVQHTHTDIGYTRPQTEILPEHLRFIDHALDYCDQTDDYPDDAKFRWTCETGWSVREYLRSRPQEQIDRLLKRVKENRIEVTGMFLNFSEIIDEPALVAQTKTLRMFKNMGIDVTTAMQNDVNGIAWCLVDYYHNTDVKYLTMGLHAHRARKPFNKPTSFWWQSPAGKRLLAYRSEHYMHGNALGVTSDQEDILRNNLSNYLSALEEKDYPYNKVSLQFSGYATDNSPPSIKTCDIIKEWNDKYEWPRLRSALARDFMVFLDEQHAEDIPKKEVAWPDWWTDGVGSAANETKEVRKAHLDISATSNLLTMGKILGLQMPEQIQTDIEKVYDNLLFYDEHTHGASESVRDPLAQNTINQWGMKSSYAWEAAKKAHAAEEKVLAFLEPAFNKSNTPTIAIFNTLNWNRSGMVELFIENELLPDGEEFIISDGEGNVIPYQIYDHRAEGAYYGLWVDNIPAFGYKTLQIKVGKNLRTNLPQKSNELENRFYRLKVDVGKGVISELFDKKIRLNLIDPKDTLTLGQFIYEELDNRHEMERLTNSSRDTIYKPLGMKRSILSDIKITRQENGPIYNSIFLNGKMPICADYRGLSIEIRLYHFQKKVEMLYKMFKLPVTSPEGVYVAFPFHLDNGKLAFEAQGGVVYPGKNQLEGSSSDWNTIQNFAAVKGDQTQIVFVSNEIPLVQFGAINTGRYYYRLNPTTNHIYSWVLNNYWVTNFKASQEGELRWKYSITSSKDDSDMFATKFGWGDRVPLKSRIMLPTQGAQNTTLESKSVIELGVDNLLLVSTAISADQKGVILHLREVEGGHAILDSRRILEQTGATSIHEVNILEEEIALLSAPLLIEHYETKFIKLNFD